jgi:hypothetical protein
VCRQWEAATQAAVHAGIRTVCLRTGLVLGADGGVLHTLRFCRKLWTGTSEVITFCYLRRQGIELFRRRLGHCSRSF